LTILVFISSIPLLKAVTSRVTDKAILSVISICL
jgi:hypothetical protein